MPLPPEHRATSPSRVEVRFVTLQAQPPRLTLLERIVERTTFEFNVARVLAAIALIILAINGDKIAAQLPILLRFVAGS